MKSTLRMAVFALLVALGGVAGCFAQVDMPVQVNGPYTDVGRALTWAGSGTGAINNNFILPLTQPTNYACVFLTNNDTSTHTLTVNFWGSGDPKLNAYTGVSSGKWYNIPSIPSFASVLSGSTIFTTVQTQGLARLVISITAGSGTGTADIFVIQSNAGCNGASLNTISTKGFTNPTAQCDSIAAPLTVAAAATSVWINNGASILYVCHADAQIATTTTTAGSVLIQSSTTAGACVGLTTLFTYYPQGVAVGSSVFSQGGNLGWWLRQNPTQAATICITNNSTGGSIQVNGTYATE